MRINLNTKKRQKSLKKVTENINNNYCYNNNLKLQSFISSNSNNTTTLINPYIKWSRCNSNNLKLFRRGSIDNKKDTSLILSNLTTIEKQLKIRNKSMIKPEFGIIQKTTLCHSENVDDKKSNVENGCHEEEKLIIEKRLDDTPSNLILQNSLQNFDHSENEEKEIFEMEKEKEMKEEEQRKKKMKEENFIKMKQCFNNTPYPTLLSDNDENNFYNNIYINNSNPNSDNEDNNNKCNEYHNENEENYNSLLLNIKSTSKSDISCNSYVNQIPNEILIKIFNNPMFSQNDYYKFCLVCKSWNEAATIVLWNKPYIYSFHQLVKFYQCLLYNDEILKINREISEARVKPIKYINHHLSKLVNKLDLTRVRLERPISTRQRTELFKALNILGDKLMPYLNSLSICREQCNSYLFLGTSIVDTNEDYSNQALIPSTKTAHNNNNISNNENDLCFKEISFPSVHNLRFIDLNYKSITSLFKSLKKFNNIETLYISIALFQSWKEWNSNNRLNNYLIFQKVIDSLNAPFLKKIRLQNCCDLNDDACFTLFNKCHDISELEILGSSNVSIDVIYYSIKLLKDLKILSYTAIATPQFKLTEDNEDENENENAEGNNNDDDKKKMTMKKGPMAIDLTNKPKASQIQIIDINSTGWSPYLNWLFDNQSCHSLKKLILTIQTEDERDTIYKAVSSCPSMEELIITYRHEANNENVGDGLLVNEQLTIDLDKLFLVKTDEYQSNIKFLHISGLEIEKSKRLTKYIEKMEKENENKDEFKNQEIMEKSKYLKFNKLKYLHLYLPSSKCPIEHILYQFPGLEEFVLNLSEPVEEEVIENENEHNIENSEDQNQTHHEENNNNELIMDNNNNEVINRNPKISIDNIESKVKRLSIRSSSFGDGFSDKQISSIIEKCPSITNLELDCKSLTEDCLCHCIEFLKGNLVSLRLERVNRSTITDRFLDCLCQNNPLIQQLEIFAEHGKLDVTKNGTNDVIEKCKNLKYFSLGLEGFNPIIPYYLEQPSNYRSYFKNLNYTSKKKFI